MNKQQLCADDPHFEDKYQTMQSEYQHQAQFQPKITHAHFDIDNHLIKIKLNNGLEISLPPKFCQEIAELDDHNLTLIEVGPGGDSILWDEAGMGIEITSILAGRFGSRKWMNHMHEKYGIPLGLWPDSEAVRSEWGRIGGSITSKAKTAAVRQNGTKGGRPRKVKPEGITFTTVSAISIPNEIVKKNK